MSGIRCSYEDVELGRYLAYVQIPIECGLGSMLIVKEQPHLQPKDELL